VRQTFDEDGDATGSVGLIRHGLVLSATVLSTGAAFDSSVDIVIGNRRFLRLLDRVVQCGIALVISTAGPGRHLDVLDQLREQFSAFGVDDCLLVLRRRPFGVARHWSLRHLITSYATGSGDIDYRSYFGQGRQTISTTTATSSSATTPAVLASLPYS